MKLIFILLTVVSKSVGSYSCVVSCKGCATIEIVIPTKMNFNHFIKTEIVFLGNLKWVRN